MFKKALLTLSFMAVIGMITAQSLQFEYEGTVYEEGQTIVCEYDDDMLEYNKKEIHIRNLTDEQQDVIVEKEVIEHLNGTQNYFCWGNCYIPTTIVSDPNPVAANSLSTDDLSFHFLYDEGIVGRTSVRIYAYTRSNPDERISVVFVADNVTNTTENFLGLGTVILTGAISKGTFYATATDNIVAYYINVAEANGLGDAFDFTTDAETGMIGIHEDGNYARMQEETVAVSGITLFAERLDGVIVGTISSNPS